MSVALCSSNWHLSNDQPLHITRITWSIMCAIQSGDYAFRALLACFACFAQHRVVFPFARSLSVFLIQTLSVCLFIPIPHIAPQIYLPRTSVRSSVTRNADPGTCCSQSFDSDGWKRDTKIPWYDAIDRALRALSNDTKLASNGSSVAEIQSLQWTKVTLKIAKNSIPRSHCP